MKSMMSRCAALLASLSICAHAQGQVVLAGGSGGGAHGEKLTLNQVGVQRGGIGDNYFYTYGEMIGVSLDEVNIPGASPTDLRTVLLYANPLDGNRGNAFTDQYVNTGFFDMGKGNGDFQSPGAEFIKVDFDEPVKNDVGPDVLVSAIGVQLTSFFASPDPYHVSFDGINSVLVDDPDEFRLLGVDSIPYYAYQGGVTSPSQLGTDPIQSTGGLGNATATATPVLHSLDLSDFGIAEGATVSSMYLQDQSAINSRAYPTMVLGLPAIPEPTTAALLGTLSLVLVGKRRKAR